MIAYLIAVFPGAHAVLVAPIVPQRVSGKVYIRLRCIQDVVYHDLHGGTVKAIIALCFTSNWYRCSIVPCESECH